jgi:hypothetical protein
MGAFVDREQTGRSCDITGHVAIFGAHPRNERVFGMIANAITVPIGPWLAYSAIFSKPAPPQKLDSYLASPARTVPGNKVPFAGVPNA